MIDDDLSPDELAASETAFAALARAKRLETVTKAFDPNEPRDPKGEWTAGGASGKKIQRSLLGDDDESPAAPAPAAKKRSAKPKPPPELTEEQRDALRALAEAFPGGIEHLYDHLHKGGKIDPEIYESDEDKQARKEAAHNIESHKLADAEIRDREAANKPTKDLIVLDTLINKSLNELPSAEDFKVDVDNDELGGAFSNIVESLEAIEGSDFPDYNVLDPADYVDDSNDIPDADEYEDDAQGWADAVFEVRNEREREAETFAADSDVWVEDVAAASADFRKEQSKYLTTLRDEIKDALAIPRDDMIEALGEEGAADAKRLQLERMSHQVDSILKMLH